MPLQGRMHIPFHAFIKVLMPWLRVNILVLCTQSVVTGKSYLIVQLKKKWHSSHGVGSKSEGSAFKLTSAPATFQRMMGESWQDVHWQTLFLYLDDMIMMAPDFTTRMARLKEVFEKLRQEGLKLSSRQNVLFCRPRSNSWAMGSIRAAYRSHLTSR